jgi:hypothetical protein
MKIQVLPCSAGSSFGLAYPHSGKSVRFREIKLLDLDGVLPYGHYIGQSVFDKLTPVGTAREEEETWNSLKPFDLF